MAEAAPGRQAGLARGPARRRRRSSPCVLGAAAADRPAPDRGPAGDLPRPGAHRRAHRSARPGCSGGSRAADRRDRPRPSVARRTSLASSTSAGTSLIVGGGIVGAGALLDATSRGLQGRPHRADRHRGGDLVPLVAAHPRRPALPRAAPRPARPRGPGRAPPAAAAGAAPRVTLEPLLFPIYGWPFVTKAFYDAGLTLYDLLGARHDGGWHRRLGPADTLGIAPSLRRERAARRARLPRRHGGRRPLHPGRRAHRPGRSGRPGGRHPGAGDRACTAWPTARASSPRHDDAGAAATWTSGPSASSTRPASGRPSPDHPFGGSSMRILPSRGAHLVVPRARIPATTGLTIRVPGKIVFLVPWPEHWLIGTTDAPFDGATGPPGGRRRRGRPPAGDGQRRRWTWG